MSGLLERVRAVLADEYDVERELGGGGMGVVFLGRDRALDCPVAIKVLRMELATAVAAERFIREAQLLARVRHPAVVTVHRALSRDGLYFMIMELLEGTLADRLSARQPIPADEVIRFGEQLLEGLTQVHARGIVHRDIKPSNIFLREDGGPKLGDFGIARRMDIGEDGLTATGQIVGTPRYMSPEQLVSSEVTSTSDVYSVGMVLYEMASGRRWELEDPARGRWDGVPHRLVAVLRKALTLEPDLRWADAHAFAAALRRLGGRHRQLRAVGVGAGVVAVLGITIAAVIGLLRPGPAPQLGTERSDVAVLPLTVEGGDPQLGTSLVRATELQLEEGFGDSSLAVTRIDQFSAWAATHLKGESLPADAWEALRTVAIVQAHAVVTGDSVVVTGRVVDQDGTIRRLSRAVRGLVTERGNLGCGIAVEIVDAIKPDRRSAFACATGYGNVDAINAYLEGRAAFARDNWKAAEDAFRRAVALDSSWIAARWSLYNVCRWGRSCDAQDTRAQLEQVYRARSRHGRNLGDLDHMLIEAELADSVPARLAIYDSAVREFGYDAYPKLLLGNELFSRGSLFGAGLDSAVAMLNAAATEDSGLSPIFEMLAWAETRLGNEPEAGAAVRHYSGIASPEQESGLSFPALLPLMFTERFGSPAEIRAARNQLEASAQVEMQSVATMLRLALAAGVPTTQLELGSAVAENADGRFQGLTAQSLALLALGRVREAFERFDQAARIAGDSDRNEMHLQELQWAVGLRALGLPSVPESLRAPAGAQLAAITKDERGARAWWILLLDALHRGDREAAAAAADHVRDAGGSPFLSRLSDAFLAAARGDTAEALRVTDSLRVWVDSHHHIADPLVRVALFLNRGRWLEERDPAAADAAWRWYENADWAGDWPSGPPKPAEMDWAFETYARYLRAQLAHAHGDTARVCAVGVDAAERWRNADAAYKSFRDSLIAWTAGCGPS